MTYTYDVLTSWECSCSYRVFDDKLGLIGETLGETLTRTTTLTQTTTNTASVDAISQRSDCFCLTEENDSVTVTVVGTPTPTATPTATPTPTPTTCEALWPVSSIITIAKGQSAANNLKVSHLIVGNIVDPAAVCPSEGPCTAHRIPVCAGTGVTIAVTGSADNTNIGRGVISCDVDGCFVDAVDVTEKYKSISADGKDTDRISLLPR